MHEWLFVAGVSFIAGFFIGAPFGALIMALLQMTRTTEEI
jgi:hypothetical protein